MADLEKTPVHSSKDVCFVEMPNGAVAGVITSKPITTLFPPLTPLGPTRLTMICFRCRTALQFPATSDYVQCLNCYAFNSVVHRHQNPQQSPIIAVRAINMVCSLCGVHNLAPWGSALVQCGHCGTITDVSRIYR